MAEKKRSTPASRRERRMSAKERKTIEDKGQLSLDFLKAKRGAGKTKRKRGRKR